MAYLDGGLVMLRSLIISASTGGIDAQLLLSNCSVQVGYRSLHSGTALVSKSALASTCTVISYSVCASQRCVAPCGASMRRNPDNAIPDRNDGNGTT